MKDVKCIRDKDLIRLWIFKVVLFLSVFAFSGFNTQILAANQHTVKTELVESKNYKTAYGQKFFQISYGTDSAFGKKVFNQWTFINLNHILVIKFKVYHQQIIFYPTTFKIAFLKFSSALEEEFPSTYLS